MKALTDYSTGPARKAAQVGEFRRWAYMKPAALCLLLPLILCGCVRGYFADQETRTLCQRDGGIHVFESVRPPIGEFPTIVPDKNIPTWKPIEATIFGKYRYVEEYTTQESHGYNIYRHQTRIVRIDDGKVLGDLVMYVRQGEPEFPGTSCPNDVSGEALINAVFFAHAPAYGACVQTQPVEHISLGPGTPSVKVRSGVRMVQGYNNRDWARGINCDGRTIIDRWYEKHDQSVTLTATRLQFFDSASQRCFALAIPDSRSVVCTPDGFFVLGYKGQQFLMQRYSSHGQLLSELEISGLPQGNLASYSETDTAVTIETAKFDSREVADCYASSIPKSAAVSMKRIGPPDTPLAIRECSSIK